MAFEVLEAPVERDAQGAGRKAGPILRVGIPTTGGRILKAAKDAGYSVLFSTNAFMVRDGRWGCCGCSPPRSQTVCRPGRRLGQRRLRGDGEVPRLPMDDRAVPGPGGELAMELVCQLGPVRRARDRFVQDRRVLPAGRDLPAVVRGAHAGTGSWSSRPDACCPGLGGRPLSVVAGSPAAGCMAVAPGCGFDVPAACARTERNPGDRGGARPRPCRLGLACTCSE